MQSAESGPFGVYGKMAGMGSSVQTVPPGPVPDPNPDAGPSFFYQWAYVPDVRFFFPKDQITGRSGVVAGLSDSPALKSIGNIPSALATNNIAAAQNVVNGTAMTLAGASVGITLNVPIIPFSGILNGGSPVTAAITLDFGFAFANCTSGNAVVSIAANTSQNYSVGMPLVIGGVGNSGGTVPLLTQVLSIQTAANTITLTNPPLATNATAPVGTGNLWSQSGNGPSGGALPPTAASASLAAGPALLLDSGQAMTRGVQVVGAAGSVGGTFTVRGWDIFCQPMSETITVAAASVGWGKKAFKYIASVTPNVTDAHNYTVGTSDVFGFAWAAAIFENTQIYWASTLVTGTPTGFVGGTSASSTSTATTGDVRGTVQTSANGGGTGIGATASNGTISSLVMTGNRLDLFSRPSLRQMIYSDPNNAALLYGPTQA